MSLRNKSLHDIRVIAQSYGIDNIFAKDQIHLIQEIELKQRDLLPKPKIDVEKPAYDARLMTKPPSKSSSEKDIKDLLKPFTDKGMHLTFPSPDTWMMRHGKKTDTGSMRMPLRVIWGCAEKVTR